MKVTILISNLEDRGKVTINITTVYIHEICEMGP